jgi:hypothetical protein
MKTERFPQKASKIAEENSSSTGNSSLRIDQHSFDRSIIWNTSQNE